ncbi:MAG: NAD(P)H-binding protein [Rhodospirillaceae bacterium]
MKILHRFLALFLAAALWSSSSQAETALVFGATGQLGARVVKLLIEDGHDVVAFVRASSDRSPLDGLIVKYAVGNMIDQQSVKSAFERQTIDVVINTARAPTDLEGFYKLSSTFIAEAAEAAGVKQIIHHGAVGAGSNMALHPDVPWDRVPALVPRMIDHGVAEEIFFSIRVPTTIIRNSRVWPDDTPATGNAKLTEDRRVLTPITRIDLARFTMDCLLNETCYGKVYHNRDDSLTWPPPSFLEGAEE